MMYSYTRFTIKGVKIEKPDIHLDSMDGLFYMNEMYVIHE